MTTSEVPPGKAAMLTDSCDMKSGQKAFREFKELLGASTSDNYFNKLSDKSEGDKASRANVCVCVCVYVCLSVAFGCFVFAPASALQLLPIERQWTRNTKIWL